MGKVRQKSEVMSVGTEKKDSRYTKEEFNHEHA